MLTLKIIFLLCLFLSAVSFLSCGDINNTKIQNYPYITYPSFAKVYHYQTTDCFFFYPTNECVMGDTMGLTCHIYDTIDTNWPIIAKITTLGGDEEFIKLFENHDAAYIGIVPCGLEYIAYFLNEDMCSDLPQKLLLSSHIPIRFESKPELQNGILSISPDGDVLMAEINYKNQTKKVILNIRSK